MISKIKKTYDDAISGMGLIFNFNPPAWGAEIGGAATSATAWCGCESRSRSLCLCLCFLLELELDLWCPCPDSLPVDWPETDMPEMETISPLAFDEELLCFRSPFSRLSFLFFFSFLCFLWEDEDDEDAGCITPSEACK